MLYHFQVILRWIMMTLKRSLKVIQTATIRKLGCGFLFAFRCNYGSILHYLREKAIYWSKSWFFSYPLHLTPPLGGPRRNITTPFGVGILEWWGYPMVEKLWGYMYVYRNCLDIIPACDRRTDRQTSCHGIFRAMGPSAPWLVTPMMPRQFIWFTTVCDVMLTQQNLFTHHLALL